MICKNKICFKKLFIINYIYYLITVMADDDDT